MILNQEESIKCPRCKLKSAKQFNFGKKGHCMNCSHNWKLSWKGSKTFSNQIRNMMK